MTSAIPSVTRAMLDGLGGGSSGSMILIHRTQSKDPSRRFRTVPVNIDDGINNAFKERAKLALENIKANEKSISKFSDPTNANSYVEVEAGVLADLDTLLGRLKSEKSFHGSHNFDEVKEKGISCYVLKSEQKRVFIFFNVGKNNLDPDRHIVSKLTGDGLLIQRDKLVIFENKAFAVYYEEAQSLLMIDYNQTKKLLSFNEQFKIKCKAVLDESLDDLVSLEADDLDGLLNVNATNEKITKMDARGVFEGADREIFAEWNKFYDTMPLEGTRKVDLGNDGKAIIRNRDDLEMTLRILNNDIVEAVNARGTFAMATGKKELKVSRPASPRLSSQSQMASRKGGRVGRGGRRQGSLPARRAGAPKARSGTGAAGADH